MTQRLSRTEDREAGPSSSPSRLWGEFLVRAARAPGARSRVQTWCCARVAKRSPGPTPGMGREMPPRRGCGTLRRCLFGAALLLGLRLCAELRRAAARPPTWGAPPGPAIPPPGPYWQRASGPPRGASRRQVTYVRSGRRAPKEPGCCAPRGHPRRKVSCNGADVGPCDPKASPTRPHPLVLSRLGAHAPRCHARTA